MSACFKSPGRVWWMGLLLERGVIAQTDSTGLANFQEPGRPECLSHTQPAGNPTSLAGDGPWTEKARRHTLSKPRALACFSSASTHTNAGNVADPSVLGRFPVVRCSVLRVVRRVALNTKDTKHPTRSRGATVLARTSLPGNLQKLGIRQSLARALVSTTPSFPALFHLDTLPRATSSQPMCGRLATKLRIPFPLCPQLTLGGFCARAGWTVTWWQTRRGGGRRMSPMEYCVHI